MHNGHYLLQLQTTAEVIVCSNFNRGLTFLKDGAMSMASPISKGHKKSLKTLQGPDINITVTRSLLSSLREPIELPLIS